MERETPDRRILLVEDEYMIAQDMAYELKTLGAEVIGPVGSLDAALELARTAEVEIAFLDINLNGERAYPIADILLERGVKVVFTTGYDENVIPARYAEIPRCGKPLMRHTLKRMLETMSGLAVTEA